MSKITFDKNKNIDNELFHGKPTAVLVHAEWCRHCIELFPKFKDLAQELKNSYNFVLIESKYYGEKIQNAPNDLKGFPTVLIFDRNGNRNDEVVGYNGEMTLAEIKQKLSIL